MKKYLLIMLTIFSFNLFSDDIKVGLTLSGGGARGFAHVGLLKVIDDIGLEIDYISGTSMGAAIGALYSCGYSADEIENIILTTNWIDIFQDDLKRKDIYITEKRWKPFARFPFQLDDKLKLVLPKGLSQGHNIINNLFQNLYDFSDYRDFSTLPIPFQCTSTDLVTGNPIVFDKGFLHEAVRASMSVPSLLEPFELNGQLLIDGGIRLNLPAELIRDSCDVLIGSKVNTELFDKEELGNFLDVLNQTINISMTDNIENSQLLCNVVLIPEIKDYSSTDFLKAQEIIDAGEKTARKNIKYLKSLVNKQNKRNYQPINSLPSLIKFSDIQISGNKIFDKDKVLKITTFKKDTYYSKKDIIRKCQKGYNYKLFSSIYPKIKRKKDGSYLLKIKVKERTSIQSKLILRYNLENELIIGQALEFYNKVLNNSKLLFHFKIGGISEINADYVKKIGNFYGIYYHLFPFYRRENFYNYDDEHNKTKTNIISKYGFNQGIGIFFNKYAAFEIYDFYYNTNIYNEIPEIELKQEAANIGYGFKFYHESLDNFIFPLDGGQVLIKYSTTVNTPFDKWNDYEYKRFVGKAKILFKISRNQAFLLQFDYCSYLEGNNPAEPFYIGGIGSYLGAYENEYNTYNYKYISAGLRTKFLDRFYLDFKFNSLAMSDKNVWNLPDEETYSLSTQIGIDGVIIPIRAAASVDINSNFRTYLSFGYDFDNFSFSRP